LHCMFVCNMHMLECLLSLYVLFVVYSYPLPIDYIYDLPLNRNQLDSKSNLHGTILTNICKYCQMRIVNGKFLGDSLGYYTFFNTNGKNTVDYMIAYIYIYVDSFGPERHIRNCIFEQFVR
jgi:hypothetical protein